MINSKFSIKRVAILWNSLSALKNYTPLEIAIHISDVIGYNPIPITLLAQQSDNHEVRSQAIQAYYYLMEEEMVRKSMELSITG